MRLKKTLGVLALAMVGGVLTVIPPAQAADPGDHVLGHRCRTYENRVTNENTVESLRDTSEMPGAICEIDSVTIADGTVIVVHDGTWRRTADASTLPAGVTRESRVVNATWAQVRQIRTKGGEPIPRLEDMIVAAGQYDIGMYVDMRNRIPNPSFFVNLANQVGADVGYYQLLQGNCSHGNTDRMRDAGARIGVKLLGECPTTPAQMQAMGGDVHPADLLLHDRRLHRGRQRPRHHGRRPRPRHDRGQGGEPRRSRSLEVPARPPEGRAGLVLMSRGRGLRSSRPGRRVR